MPIRSENATTGGTEYVDIRIGEGHGIHQMLIGAGAPNDTDGYVPVGAPLLSSGAPVTNTATVGTEVAYAIVGPEAVRHDATATMGNVIFSGAINRDALEDNLGRALSANEVAAIEKGLFTLV